MSETAVIAGLNWLDLVLLSIIVLAAITGIARGLTKTLVSVITWISAIYLAYKFADDFTGLTEPYANAEIRLWTMRIAIFVVVMILGATIGSILQKLVAAGGLGGVDKLLGIIFGIVLGVVIVSILILISGMTQFPANKHFKTSVLIPHFMDFVSFLRELLPENVQQEINFPADST